MPKDARSTEPSVRQADDDPRLFKASQEVAEALQQVHLANEKYKDACTRYGHLKIDIARERGHPWEGFSVWRAVDSGNRKKLQRGIVTFKGLTTPDYGNTHIPPGHFFVLTDNQQAKWLDDTWQLELL